MNVSDRPLYWWTGIASILPRTTAIPASENLWIDRWNELRWRIGRPPVFPWPKISKAQVRALVQPTRSGLGDLLCAWLMPMTLGDLMGWRVRIPVPRDAGGIHHDSRRARLTPEWFHKHFDLPAHVELIHREEAPADCDWFCTIEPQWYLNACTETSFDTIPSWLRSEPIDRLRYYARYADLAAGLLRVKQEAFFGREVPFLALHARRGDRGGAEDDRALSEIVSRLAQEFRYWVVVSDDAVTRDRLVARLRKLGCLARTGTGTPPGAEPSDPLMGDFRAMVGAQAVVCSVKGGWSSLPYAATRLSGAPLLFTARLAEARIWRHFSRYSQVPIRGVYLGPSEVNEFAEAAACRLWPAPANRIRLR